MASTSPKMLPLGSQAPDFHLPDVASGKTVSLEDFAGKKALVVIFLCRHCPYVVHVADELARLGRDYPGKGVGIVGIGANDATTYPDDAPDKLREFAKERGIGFPILYDESQNTAKAYTAVCTPDTFVFDSSGKLVYRGQLDDTRPNSGQQANGHDLRAALDAILSNSPVASTQKPSVGCGIKWKPGNAPA